MKNNTYLEIMNNVSAAYRAYEKDHIEDTSAGLTVGQWLEEYKGMMVACVRPWLTSLQKHGYELEDLLQEASIVVLSAWETYDSNRSGILSGTYFWKVITNAMCDLYRTCNAQKRTSVALLDVASFIDFVDEGAEDEDYEYPYSDGYYVSSGAQARQTVSNAAAYSAMDNEEYTERDYEYGFVTSTDTVDTHITIDSFASSLDSIDETIMRLRMQGYTEKEISNVVGKSLITVKRRLRRIREQYNQEVKV